MSTSVILPEWAPQDAVLLAWPRSDMDWAYILPDVHDTYVRLIGAITRYEPVVLLCECADEPRALLQGRELDYPVIYAEGVRLNDTWARDFAPLTLADAVGGLTLVDYGFNAWGMKFAADRDNRVVRYLVEHTEVFAPEVGYRKALDFICEGGALEYNGEGLLLTTASVLGEPNRNPTCSIERQRERLKRDLGVAEVKVLDVPPLPGDDTDGHIDTMVRFVSPRVVVCHDTGVDSELTHSVREWTEQQGFTLVMLPTPDPIYDEEGMQLPATYANFLIVNGALLLPTYGQPVKDHCALELLRKVVAPREVIGVDCRSLIRQHGSLHCVTMQLPRGVLNPKLMKQ